MIFSYGWGWRTWFTILGLLILGAGAVLLFSRAREVHQPEPVPTEQRAEVVEVSESPGYSFEPPDGWSRSLSGGNPFVSLLDNPPEVVVLEPGAGAALGVIRVEELPDDVLQQLAPSRLPKGARSSGIIVGGSSGVLVSYRSTRVRMRVHAAVFRMRDITFVALLTAPPGSLHLPRDLLADTLATWEWSDS